MKKEDSLALQGVAVLMMVLHHYFLDITVYPESFFMFPAFFQRFAWAGRICVAIFSFVSGYGMYHVMKKKNSVSDMTKDCGKRLVQLYARLFLVILLCVYLPGWILREEIFISKLWGNVFGYNPTYNGAWWFVFEYMWFMLLSIILAMIVQEKRNKYIRGFLALGLVFALFWGKGYVLPDPAVIEFFEVRMQPTFLILFTQGFCVGKLQEWLRDKKVWERIQKYGKFLRTPVIGIVLCLTILILRYLLTDAPMKATMDILLVPMFCWGAALGGKWESGVKKGFVFLGKNSLYLWFVHNIVYDRMFSFVRGWTGYWLVFFCLLFGVSLALAIFLKKLEGVFNIVTKKCRRT